MNIITCQFVYFYNNNHNTGTDLQFAVYSTHRAWSFCTDRTLTIVALTEVLNVKAEL